jgi:hypothetical protein
MAKGYWIATYRSVSDPDALARYASSQPRSSRRMGAILARGTPARFTRPPKRSAASSSSSPAVGAAISTYEVRNIERRAPFSKERRSARFESSRNLTLGIRRRHATRQALGERHDVRDQS